MIYLGHSKTDAYLNQASNVLQDISSVPFNDSLLHFNNDNFMIDWKGGNFLQIVNLKEFPSALKNIKEKEQLINSRLEAPYFHTSVSTQVANRNISIHTAICKAEAACTSKNLDYKSNLPANDTLKLQVFSESLAAFLKKDPTEEEEKRYLDTLLQSYQKVCHTMIIKDTER